MSTRDLAPILHGVLSAAASALSEAGVPPGRVELTPGTTPAWDDCCDGQLYLRVLEVYPTAGVGAAFPTFDANQRGASLQCSVNLLDVHVGLGIMRCAAMVDDQGNAPSPAQVTSDGDEMLADMSTLLEVILCTVPGLPGVQQAKLDRWSPQGVNGGCHGGEWGIHLAIDPCVKCP